ncbi:MAG: DUF2064 domain-containing protein [Pseudomonadota bacterium]
MTTNTTTLTLVCKRPRKGVGKQRIASQLGSSATQALADLLLACAVEDLTSWEGDRAILVAQAEDVAWAKTLCSDAFVVAQCEGNLGERLMQGSRTIRDNGCTKLMLIGSDCPTLSADYLHACANALQHNDIVLGDASDGGVVVMGSRVQWPALADLPWSTDRLADSLAQRCAQSGLSVARHTSLSDVDEASQLEDLFVELEHDRRPARRALRYWLDQFLQARSSNAAHA